LFDESVVCGTCDGGLTKLNKNSLIDMTPFPKFDLVIIDEAHHIKNPNTYAYQAAHMFCDNAESIVLLTATPGVGENNKVGRAEISKYLGFLGTEEYIAKAFGVELNQRTNVATEPGTYATNVKNVFVAGDMHRGQSLVVWAIREGREVAHDVDTSLMGYSYLSVQ
jgi:glutamate synthase (NADPH/NADH) small chain